MAVPKDKTSHARSASRRAQWLRRTGKRNNIVLCPHCGEPMLAYHVCPSCGYYKGREVIKVEEPEEE